MLVFGGLDQGGLVADAEIYDPARQTSEAIATNLAPRAYHTATLLTDRRVLIAGGIGPDGQPLNKLELWNPRTRALEPFDARLTFARRGHTARLLTNGNVEIRGGLTAAGTAADPEIIVIEAQPAETPDELKLAARSPPPTPKTSPSTPSSPSASPAPCASTSSP